jgi:hypothetical protein
VKFWNRTNILAMLGCILLLMLIVAIENLSQQYVVWAFRLKAMLALSCSFLLFRYVSARSEGYLLPRLCGLMYGVQALIILVLSILEPNAYTTNIEHFFRLREHANVTLVALVLMQAGPVIALWLLKPLYHTYAKFDLALRERVSLSSDRFAYFLGFAAFIRFLYPLQAQGILGGMGFFARVLQAMLMMAPLFVPMLSSRYRKLKLVWIGVIVFTGAYGILTGGRFVALFPVVLYGIGMVLAMPPGFKKRALKFAAVVAVIPFLLFINFLGDLRDQLGRVGYDEVNASRVQTFSSAATDIDGTRDTDDTALHRLINWPNLVVPAFTPEKVDYRGLDNLQNEAARFVDIGFISGTTREELFAKGLATAPATRYGFRVTTSTSVEFGVLADGWSRAGPWGALLYSVLLTLVLGLVEIAVVNSRMSSRDLALILTIPLMGAALLTARSDPLYSTFRHLWMDFTLLAIVLVLLRVVYTEFLRPSERQR